MFRDDIKTALRKQPFIPFIVYTSDSERFRVHHQDYAFLSPLGGSLEIWGEDGRKLIWLNTNQITRLESERNDDDQQLADAAAKSP